MDSLSLVTLRVLGHRVRIHRHSENMSSTHDAWDLGSIGEAAVLQCLLFLGGGEQLRAGLFPGKGVSNPHLAHTAAARGRVANRATHE